MFADLETSLRKSGASRMQTVAKNLTMTTNV